MSPTKKVSLAFIIIGFVGTFFSLFSDLLGFGSRGVQAVQLLGMQIGILLAALGVGMFLAAKNQRLKFWRFTSLKDKFLSIPTAFWFIVGFFIVTVFLFIFPVFFNDTFRMRYFLNYIPNKYPIGVDIRLAGEALRNWLVQGQSPYASEGVYYYPPLFNVVFAPLVLLGYPAQFYFMTIVTLISFFILVLQLPLMESLRSGHRKFDMAMTMFFALTGILSYGMQFEIERGQFNVFAFMLCIVSIYIFHFYFDFRHLAYLLFSVAVQLKVYPAIFIVMFIKDWKNWKTNILRFLGLGLFNISLLFVLGPSILSEFLNSISTRVFSPFHWIGNHSIYAFVYNLTNGDLGIFNPNALEQLQQYTSLLQNLLIGYFLFCFAIIILKSYKIASPGINKYLLFICTIGAMVLPADSHDYKLSILAPIMTLLFAEEVNINQRSKKIFAVILFIVIAMAYSVTLYPFKYRPDFLANSFPALFVLLTTVTVLFLLVDKKVGTQEIHASVKLEHISK